MDARNGLPVHLVLAACILYFGWFLAMGVQQLFDRVINSMP